MNFPRNGPSVHFPVAIPPSERGDRYVCVPFVLRRLGTRARRFVAVQPGPNDALLCRVVPIGVAIQTVCIRTGPLALMGPHLEILLTLWNCAREMRFPTPRQHIDVQKFRTWSWGLPSNVPRTLAFEPSCVTLNISLVCV